MVIELTALQNFLLAALAVLALGVVIFSLKKALQKDNKHVKHPDQESNVTADGKTEIHDGLHHQGQHPSQTVEPEKREISGAGYRGFMQIAKDQAQTLLYETTKEAARMITEAKQTHEKMEEDLDKVLHNVAENDIRSLKSQIEHFDQSFNQNLEQIQTQMQSSLAEMAENTKKLYEDKLDEFLQQMLKNSVSSQSEVDKKTTAMITAAENEISEYKKSKMSQIDEQVNQLIQKVYRDVLHISMSENVHQELIMKSLEQAKKDGLFKL